jgi:hypothetical protein
MHISEKLGLTDEIFCRMVIKTKMLFSNVLGHVGELHYENFLNKNKIPYIKAKTDAHYDYVVDNNKDQIKRFETASTNEDYLSVNLTQTHGDRTKEGNFYCKTDFDRLVIYDVLFKKFQIFSVDEIPTNKKYHNYFQGKFKIKRDKDIILTKEQLEFLNVFKIKNKLYPEAIDNFKKKMNISYSKLLEYTCDLSLDEIDTLFTEKNFRLVTGAKGFSAEEHFNVLLENNNIPYTQDKDMYSKVDHWVNNNIRVQVKIPHLISVNENQWAFKTHKSHGSGVKELYKNNEFDYVALFIGFKMNETLDKYLPASVTNEFIIIPTSDLEEHHKFKGYLKRVSTFPKKKYEINDLSSLLKK